MRTVAVRAAMAVDMIDGRPVPVPPNAGWYHSRLTWLLALAPFLALVLLKNRGIGDPLADDYAQYLMHAQALAQGRPYTDIGYIYTPLNHWLGPLAAPPGLPLALAPILALFGPNEVIIRFFMLSITIAFVLLASLYFARTENRLLGLGVAVMCALSPAMVQQASWVLTDLPLAALLWTIFYYVDTRRAWTIPTILLVTLIGGYAILVRPLGIALIPALVLYTIIHYRDYRLRPAIPVALWAGALLTAALFVNLQSASVLALNPTRVLRWLANTHWGLDHLKYYSLSVAYSHLYPFPVDAANDIFHATTVLLMFVGLIAWVRRAWRSLLFAFVCSYAALLWLIPAHQHRYLWPLYPLLVFGVLEGLRLVIARFTSEKTAFSPAAAALAFATLVAGAHAAQLPFRAEHQARVHAAETERLYAKVRSLRKREYMRVTYAKPRSLAWETGVPAMGPFSAPPDKALEELRRKGITHVIVPAQSKDRIAALPLARPGSFQLEDRSGPFLIYKFVDACHCEKLPVNSRRSCCAAGSRPN